MKTIDSAEVERVVAAVRFSRSQHGFKRKALPEITVKVDRGSTIGERIGERMEDAVRKSFEAFSRPSGQQTNDSRQS